MQLDLSLISKSVYRMDYRLVELLSSITIFDQRKFHKLFLMACHYNIYRLIRYIQIIIEHNLKQRILNILNGGEFSSKTDGKNRLDTKIDQQIELHIDDSEYTRVLCGHRMYSEIMSHAGTSGCTSYKMAE